MRAGTTTTGPTADGWAQMSDECGRHVFHGGLTMSCTGQRTRCGAVLHHTTRGWSSANQHLSQRILSRTETDLEHVVPLRDIVKNGVDDVEALDHQLRRILRSELGKPQDVCTHRSSFSMRRLAQGGCIGSCIARQWLQLSRVGFRSTRKATAPKLPY